MPQYLTGEQWTEETWRAWAAGFFDRGGRISARPDVGAISVSVTAHDQWALHAIRDALGVGDIEAHARVVGLHVWRVRQPEEIRLVLDRLGPFLNTKRAEAAAALAQIDTVIARRAQRAERDRRILALREQGRFSNAEIADRVGSTPHIVANVISRWRRTNSITIHTRAASRRV